MNTTFLPQNSHCNIKEDIILYAQKYIDFLFPSNEYSLTTSISQLLGSVFEKTNQPIAALLLAVLYLERLKSYYPYFKGSSDSSVKLLLAALIIANKYLMDDTYHNKAWSIVSGFVSPSQICDMEMELVHLLHWHLYVERQEWLWFLERASQGIEAVSCRDYGSAVHFEESITLWDAVIGEKFQTIIRDFAYPSTDPRYSASPARPSSPSRQTSYSYLQNKHIFTTPTQITASNSILKKLTAILHKTSALDDDFRFTLKHCKAIAPFSKVSDWELNLKPDQTLVRLGRDNPSAGERWASIDTLDVQLPSGMVNLYLDPDPNVFASQWREFVEYQKVYGNEWCCVCDLNTAKQDNSVMVQIRGIGLVPCNVISE